MDPECYRLDRLLHQGDPETAWPQVLEYVTREPNSHQTWTLVEDLIYLHADLFIDRIEAEVRSNPLFREAVSGAYIGGIGGP